jgi:hypothetical protein
VSARSQWRDQRLSNATDSDSIHRPVGERQARSVLRQDSILNTRLLSCGISGSESVSREIQQKVEVFRILGAMGDRELMEWLRVALESTKGLAVLTSPR